MLKSTIFSKLLFISGNRKDKQKPYKDILLSKIKYFVNRCLLESQEISRFYLIISSCAGAHTPQHRCRDRRQHSRGVLSFHRGTQRSTLAIRPDHQVLLSAEPSCQPRPVLLLLFMLLLLLYKIVAQDFFILRAILDFSIYLRILMKPCLYNFITQFNSSKHYSNKSLQ